MTVGELRDMLEEHDEDAEVVIISQESWPFEHRIKGVITRSDVDGEDHPEDEGSGDTGESHSSFSTRGKSTDVLLVEGGQIRYSKREYFEIV